MSKNRDLINLAIYIIIFFSVWSFYELLIKPQILELAPIPSAFIQAIIKVSCWTIPSVLLIKRTTTLQVPYPKLFQTKIYWENWILLLGLMILFLLGGSYLGYGNLQIRETFQPIDLINSVLLVGLTEELVFRGWILNFLLTKMNKFGALILSSSLFLLIHFPTWIHTGTLIPNLVSGGFMQVFFLGILFGIAFIKSKNIFVPMLFHMVWNLIAITYYG
ncbi:lysostaphin resistance A-like protein [Enterococcus sp. LJL90]